MQINVRLEGGLGDCILGTRFVPAILEKYPGAKVTAFTDTNGNTFQKEGLEAAFKYLYQDIQVIPSKKYKEFWVDCQFGTDNYLGGLENVPDEWRKKMENADKFYDLHIDSLKWTQYDFDWFRYFYFFPKADIQMPAVTEKYIVCHLASDMSVGHRLEQWYIDRLVTDLSKISHVVLIATEKTKHLFKHLESDCVTIRIGEIDTIFQTIKGANAMVSTDSGFRYIAHSCGLPVLTFSANSPAPHQVIPSHRIRWLLFPESVFPLNFNSAYIANSVKRILEEKGVALLPYITDFDIQMVRRKYKINLDKTVCW